MIRHVLHASACIYSLLGVMAGFVGIYSPKLINAKSDIAPLNYKQDGTIRTADPKFCDDAKFR